MNWRRIIFDNYKAKAAILLMALFLWFFVVSSRIYVQTLDVPLQIHNLKPDKVLVEDLPEEVAVRFRGRGTALLLLGLVGRPRLELDLSGINRYYEFPLRPEQVNWAMSIDVQPVEVVYPDTVSVILDDVVRQSMAVRPMLMVHPADNYLLTGAPHCDPDTVTVQGARSVLAEMKYAPTKARTVENVTGSVDMKLELLRPTRGQVVFDPPAVQVRAEVEKIKEKGIGGVPVALRSLHSDLKGYAEPARVDLVVRGAASLVENLVSGQISVLVEVKGTGPGMEECTPVVSLPEGVSLIKVNPPSIQVTLE
ncbi:MAG: hypothetical protein C4524_04660 [Candidatus Zixiibacteriota bacterium]|nr:MAG: hypothetical protein C4524_04660 [candidate division Zixibacteria bacterium]